MSKRFIIAMVFTLLFTLAGCKSIGTLEGKAGEPVISDVVDKIEEDNNNEGRNLDDVEDTSGNMVEITDIIMTTEKDTYTHGVKEIILNIENKSSNEFYYGVAFTLEQKVDGEWILLSPKEDVFVIEIAYILEANGVGTIVSNLTPYGDLEDGHYRIVKEMIKQTSGEDESTTIPESYKVTAEFNISSEVAQSDRLAAVYLSIENEIYTKKDEILNYTIGNNTGETKNVVLAPRLEKETGGEWVMVECETGFSATPDTLGDKIEGQIDLSWYPSISDGIYLLTFDIQEEGGETTQISDIFTFSE